MNMGLPPGHLYGQSLKTRQVSDLTFTEIVYPPRCEVPRHSHELSQFCLVLNGTFSEVYGRKTRQGMPLTLIARPSNEMHAHRFHNAGAHCFVIEIGHQSLQRAREHSPTLDDSMDFRGGLIAWLAKRIYNEFYHEDNASSLAIEGLTLEMLSEASRRQVRLSGPKPPPWLEQAREFLHAHFSEAVFLKDVASFAGIHPVHLARVFRQFYHCTVGEYVRKLRIEFACREISLTDASFTEIAISAGFYDQSHFSRTFKHIVGLTPSEYRFAFRPTLIRYKSNSGMLSRCKRE